IGALFFFSSRRRHTRSYGDWSSDVCSSDLISPERRYEQLRRSRSQFRFSLFSATLPKPSSISLLTGALHLQPLYAKPSHQFDRRSEERRVGKVCRSRTMGSHN